MKNFNTILIPTDFSENARKAVQFAINNFNSNETTFVLLHSYKLSHYGAVVSVDLDDILKDDRVKAMEEEKQWVLDSFPDVQLKTATYQGMVVDIVSRYTASNDVDLIVMGTKGATGAAEVLLGSNAANVVKSVKDPLILVPESVISKPVKEVLFATDLKETQAFETIQPLRTLLKKIEGRLEIVHIASKDDKQDVMSKEELKLDTVFEDIDHKFNFLENQDIESGIIEFSVQINADMIAVVARNYGLLERIFHKSITRKLSMHTTLPLLVLREKN